MRAKSVQNYVHTPDQRDDIQIKIRGKKANAINNAHKGRTKC